MADALKWEIDLVEKISAPSEKGAKGLKSLKGEAEDAGDSVEKSGEDAGGAAVEYEAMSEMASKAAQALKAIGKAVIDATVFVTHAQEFRKNTIAALQTVGHTKSDAEATYKQIQQIANNAGLPTKQIRDWQLELETLGFSTKAAQDILNAGLDIGAITGDPAKADQVIKAMETMKAKGIMDPAELKALSTVVDVNILKQNLADARHVTVKEIDALMAAGKITADEGSKALLDTIKKVADNGGPLGSAAKKFGGDTLDGQLQALSNNFADLFSGGEGGGLVDLLKEINDLLSENSDTGKELREMFHEMWEAMATGIKIAMPYIRAIAGGIWDGMKAVIVPVWNLLKNLFAGAGTGENSPLLDGIKTLAKIFGIATAVLLVGLAAIGVAFSAVGAVIGYVVGYAVGLFTNLVEGWDAAESAIGAVAVEISDWISGVVDSFEGFIDSAISIGESFVDGIAEGIMNNIEAVIDAVVGMGDAVIDTIKGKLGISSPSKVFAGMGAFSAIGFAKGVNENADTAQTAVSDMVQPPPVGVASLAGGGGGGSGGPTSVTLAVGDVHVSGASGDPAKMARDFVEQLRPALAQLLEEMGITGGASVQAA